MYVVWTCTEYWTLDFVFMFLYMYNTKYMLDMSKSRFSDSQFNASVCVNFHNTIMYVTNMCF